MKTWELMHWTLKTIGVDATLGDAVRVLADSHVSALPVVDRFGRAVGVLSTRAVLEAEAAQRSFETLVLEVMDPWPPTVAPDVPVQEAARQMLRAGTPRLFVERHGALVGVLSQTDIVRALAAGRLAELDPAGV
jgi:CBS domain-containing protein